MINEWNTFLQTAGAEFDHAGVSNFGNNRRELSVAITGNVFADLSHFGLIAVHGKDAETFLQGQLTNDVSKVDACHSQLTGLCNPKGRLLASFRLFKQGDSYYLCLPGSMITDTLKRLRMFVLRSAVTLQDAGDTFVHLGISGSDAANTLAAVVGPLPDAVGAVCAANPQVVMQVPGIHPSYEVFASVEQASYLWNQLNVKSAPVGMEAWRLLDILAGIPVIYPQTQAAFVPQMANLQLINGISFKKGCYTGQEIIARMQYLGKLKRRMYRARVNADTPPQAGDEIFPAGDDQRQACGQLVSVASHPDGDYAVLVVLKISSTEADSGLHLESSDGPNLTLEPLPYAFAED